MSAYSRLKIGRRLDDKKAPRLFSEGLLILSVGSGYSTQWVGFRRLATALVSTRRHIGQDVGVQIQGVGDAGMA